MLNKIKKGNFIFKDLYPLTEIEMKLLILIVSRIKPKDNLAKVSYTFTYEELKNILGLKEEKLQDQLMELSGNLISKIFELNDHDEVIIHMKWVTSATYNPNKKTVSFNVLPDTRELLLLLKSKTKVLVNYDEYMSKYGEVILNLKKAICSK